MAPEYFSWGESERAQDVALPQAMDFAHAVEAHDQARLLEFRRDDRSIGLIIDLQPERPQRPAVDIRSTERLCVVFGPDENKAPNVLALRRDFPSDLPDLNYARQDQPRSLCLFAQDFGDLRRTLTSVLLLDRIFSWLTRAALDRARLPDQPLEPFLFNEARIIFNPLLFEDKTTDKVLGISGPVDTEGSSVYQIVELPFTKRDPPPPPCFLPIPIEAKPWHARVISRNPGSLLDLHELLESVGVDVIGELRDRTRFLRNRKEYDPIFMRYKWVLLLRLPKKRHPEGDVETIEDWAFLVVDEIGPLGEKLGVFQRLGRKWGLLVGDQPPSGLNEVCVCALRPVKALTRPFAQTLAGLRSDGNRNIAVVGAGAIGSQIIMNLARQGFGRWRIIDEDVLLPHNCARHALSPSFQTQYKACALAKEICVLLNEAGAAIGIDRNALQIHPADKDYARVFAGVDLIYDFSASYAVPRHLAMLEEGAPRTSAFLLSAGKFLAILAEGSERRVRLDDLEAQLPLASLRCPQLVDLFRDEEGRRIRYAGACRDVSTQLAQDVVATHSGIAAAFLKSHADTTEPSMNVWRLEMETIQISRFDLTPSEVCVHSIGGWQVRISEYANSLMQQFRGTKLPNETGGVLLGTFDIPAKIIYVVLVLPSPADSTEWPMVYRRGIQGLCKQIDEIHERTGGNLGYVGEWHSHPPGVSTLPSADDRMAHAWLIDEMCKTGHPGLMAIQGGGSAPHLMVGEK